MAGVKITTFLGIAPKVSPELLPDTASQIASNCKLYSGDLIPYPQPVIIGNCGRTGTIRTLYALRSDVGAYQWLAWETDVNIAIVTASELDDQRFYYTGDGAPKVSNYLLATTGAGTYPIGYYELGLPLPTEKLTTETTEFTTKTTVSYARDVNNTATIVTATPHGLRDGASVTITGFTFRLGLYSQLSSTVTISISDHGLSDGASVTLEFTSGGNAGDNPRPANGSYTISGVTSGSFTITVPTIETLTGGVRMDIRTFNATSTTATVVGATSFTYFSPGPKVETTSDSSGRVDLGSPPQARSYVFTWMTPWGEESIASDPSTDIYVKDGVIVTVPDLPTAKPEGNNFVRGVRLYRTLATAGEAEYFRLKTLWFPTALTSVQRTANVSRVTLAFPHNLGVEDRFKISGCSVASFDISGGIVTDIVDDYTFEYAQTAADTASTAVAAGTMFMDVSEDQTTDAARYWGDGGNYAFIDDFEPSNLADVLASDEYDAPPNDLQGLIAAQNNILIGFVGNKLYLSEPGQPHAWPQLYAKTFEYNIVGLALTNGSVLVLTEGYPYVVQGNDPASIAVQRVDVLYPCLNRKGIVSMNYGIIWPSHDGMAVYSAGSSALIATKTNFNNDTWGEELDPSTIVGAFYGDAYLASHSTGGFTFEPVPSVGGQYVSLDYSFSASWYDPVAGHLFYVNGVDGDIYQWDNLTQPPSMQTWKSKVIKTKDMLNLGAARVIADYTSVSTLWGADTEQWQNETMLWAAGDDVTFKLWVDKELIYETLLGSDAMFRLPTGYRSDTFEISVEGTVRIRAIHLAETPTGLKDA
jgi:hypothetical protein